MKLIQINIENFLGIEEKTSIDLSQFNVLIGRNDVGKSTVMKALDIFLNSVKPASEQSSIFNDSGIISIEAIFEPSKNPIIIDENVETSFEQEELVNEQGLLHIKKSWDTSKSSVSPEIYIIRKTYDENDFLPLTESQLISLCNDCEIKTRKANDAEYNNVEKRAKLREYVATQNIDYSFSECKLPTSGSSRLRNIYKAINDLLPRFEFFRANTSLSESDTSIQNYFRDIATSTLNEFGMEKVEESVNNSLDHTLQKITNKINDAVPQEEAIRPITTFDWSKVIRIIFATGDENAGIPLHLRGDGFRRITMMAYFENLAEENSQIEKNIIFGFEEPETFLHPAAQEQLFEKLYTMSESGYQIFISSHSSIIVANTNRDDLIHVYKENGRSKFKCAIENILEIADDIGISMDNQFVTLFDSAKVLLLVEGINDANAINHISKEYKRNGEIDATFDEVGIVLVPIGGCDSIKHWVALDLLQKLSKPSYIFLDSDCVHSDAESPNVTKLSSLGLVEGKDFSVTRKRALENYIPCDKLNELVPGAEVYYGDWDDVKVICKTNPLAAKLGGKKVVERHFSKLTYKDLKLSFDCKDDRDEYLVLYNRVCVLLPDK